MAAGTVGISLPFLNWNSVKWNVKISEVDYENARLNYEQRITTALNKVADSVCGLFNLKAIRN